VCAEILRDAHHYAAGTGQDRPTNVAGPQTRRRLALGRERGRDLIERLAARAGFSRRHFDPDVAAARLASLLAMSDGLDASYRMLGDDRSRRALIDVLKLRVLGPYHTPLRITPHDYRAKQAYADRELLRRRATVKVSDPWFSPLALYDAPVEGAGTVRLHSHSVDIVSVFLLGQYGYGSGGHSVRVQPGDVVIDVGGCWGDTALYFAALVGSEGKVYTFEFDPESLDVLRTNLSLNPELASRIEVVEQAVWDRSGETLAFAQGGRMTTAFAADDGSSARGVQTTTLDDFVVQAGIDRLRFVKMDVEGAELRVLSGAREALQRFAPQLAISAYHKEDDLVRIPEWLASLDLDYRLYLESFSPVEEETVLFASPVRSSA
jgi:FkbM family methyltransferase